ncbi:conserved hypothetical protein [Leishmania major strain Friedlin]|uniref:Uncharacterized protein n=1 Tax=Leishmania major TaxID=5664 RepID=Q4QJ47_LEIMA|nr:conserved hypothetical protein [Leishmania major strain Friedlin]CAG9568825.1 hypothetical_protein_-_conserved [Leishmania major strain Friedlin]CAJ02075.1 conserved hypothetical protein [Leishmania major strain Friedlin]|eukprot:XP_001680801.1 conserved hypothetical protein [Leishmania major strain Friedlin]
MPVSQCMRIAAYHASTNEADADELYASTISTDRCSSDDERAPDLEVEASPPQHDGSTDVEGVRRDVDASYFSDFAGGEARCDEQAALPPPAPLGSEVEKEGDACSRKLLPHLCSDDNSVQVVTDVVAEGDADGFCDVDDESIMANHRKDSFPAPALALDAAGRSAETIGPSPPMKSEGGRRNSWLDPLRALSTPYSKDVAAAHPKKPQLSEDVPVRRQVLPHTPARRPESRFERRTDTLPYHGGSSSVMVRGGTAAPSPPPVSELNGAASCTADQGARGYRQTNYASSSRASTLATIDAVHVLSLTDVLTNGNHKGCDGGKGASAATPTTPPRVTPRDCDARVSFSPDDTSVAANSPPPRPITVTATPTAAQHTRGNDPRTRTMLPALETTALMGPRTRVVRDRPPRGVPLILQCTGHFPTRTRTILVDDTMMDDDEGDGEDTVTAGLHTSVYKETGDRSDLSYSSSVSAEGVLLLRSGGRGGRGGRDASNGSPTPSPGVLHGRTYRVARSGSPLVSLTDAQFIGGDPATVAYQQPEPHHHDIDASPSLSPPKTWEEEEEVVDTMPDLIDFSVQTEELEPSRQDESLILCGYSVEPICASRGASAPPEVRPRHRVPPCQPFFKTSATDATASAAAFSKKGREGCAASQDVEQLQATGEGGEEGWAWPRGEASWLPQPSHLECDAVQTVSREWLPRTYTHRPSREANRAAGFDDDLPQASSPDLHDVRHLIESVEEAPAPGRGFHPPLRITDMPCEGAEVRGGRNSTPSFRKSRHVNNSVECIQATPLSSSSATRFDERSSLTLQRGRRKALHTLLARQMCSPNSSRCTTTSHEYADARASVRSARLIAPAADYVATQEQLRGQRLAAEEERARLSLVLDVCEAVRPHARDLLLMFLLLVEESNMRRRHGGRGQAQRRSNPTSDRGTAYSSHLDSSVWEESRVTYGTCAEAVNCVLERHGVTRVRATRELCRRVVAWCQHHHRGHSLLTQGASLLDSLRGTADEASVEYATFVSSVMEFAEQYPG